MGAHNYCSCMQTGCSICIWKILPPVYTTEEDDERRELLRLQRFFDDVAAEDTSTIESDNSSIGSDETIPTYVGTSDGGNETSAVRDGTDGGDNGRSDGDNGSSVRHDETYDEVGEETCVDE